MKPWARLLGRLRGSLGEGGAYAKTGMLVEEVEAAHLAGQLVEVASVPKEVEPASD